MNRILQSRWFPTAIALLLIGAGLLAVGWGALSLRGTPTPTLTVVPSPTFGERLIPTATPSPAAEMAPATSSPAPPAPSETASAVAETPSPTAQPPTRSPAPPSPSPPVATSGTATPQTTTSAPTASPTAPTPTPRPDPGLLTMRQRIGVVAPRTDIDQYDVARLGAGWYLQSSKVQPPPRPGGMEPALFVGVTGDTFWPPAAGLQDIARRNPGTLWMVGNEPDVIWQSNATPEEYARVYHEVYGLLKAADPSSRVVIGGISQVTPLRLRYLDEVRAAYEEAYGAPMPVEVWNIHLAILREERGSWGVDIPPGLPDDTGILYEIGDNADVEILKEQVWTFRRWMKERGERDKPLIVTEFSVLMPPEYGFPFETVRSFMYDSLDFLLSTRDGQLGYPADGNRLVQRCAWYSVADTVYATGNLFDPETGQITPLGRAFAEYVDQVVR